MRFVGLCFGFGFAEEGSRGSAVAVYLVADGACGAVGDAVEAADASGIVDVSADGLDALRAAVVFAFPAADAFVGVDLDVHHRVVLNVSEERSHGTVSGAEFASVE